MMHDPDDTDEFTARLSTQPPAALPAHWRTEILAAASSATRFHEGSPRWRRAADAFAAWLWPHPLAYAGLAAAWIFILAMRLLTTTPEPLSLRDPALAATGAGESVEDGAPLFASARLAGEECSWDPAVATRP